MSDTDNKEQANSVKYWAGGHDRDGEPQKDDFIAKNEWRMDFKEGDPKPHSQLMLKRFEEIQIGDEFAIKGSARGKVVIYYVGRVKAKKPKLHTLELEPLMSKSFKIDVPKGENAGNWLTALIPVERKDVIDLIFRGKKGEPPKHTPMPQKTFPLNQILYGPPGTGKTYATIRRSVEIADGVAPKAHDDCKKRFDALMDEGRIGFVTFHQSFSYEDFVEGIRPVLDGGNTARYELREGILKKMALRALGFCLQSAQSDRATTADMPSFDPLRAARSYLQGTSDYKFRPDAKRDAKKASAQQNRSRPTFEESWDQLVKQIDSDLQWKLEGQTPRSSFKLEVDKVGKRITGTNVLGSKKPSYTVAIAIIKVVYEKEKKGDELNEEKIRRSLGGKTGDLFSVDDLIDTAGLMSELQDAKNAVSKHLLTLRPTLLGKLKGFNAPASLENLKTLVDELNALLEGRALHDPAAFKGVKLFKATENLLAKNPQGKDLVRLNRRLLEDAYPKKIARAKGTLGNLIGPIVKKLWELEDQNTPPATGESISDSDSPDNPSSNVPRFVLIVDEINRGNISKILGELITLLEDDKRLGAENSLKVTLPYSDVKFGLPPNLYILGTMNTADKSLALVDVALRRRFDFEELSPDFSFCKLDEAEGKLSEAEGKVLEKLNHRITLRKDREHRIGHAYFMKLAEKGGFDKVFRRRVIPLLQEYFFNDWDGLRFVLGEEGESRNFIKPLSGAKERDRQRWQWWFDENPGDGACFEWLQLNYKQNSAVESSVEVEPKDE